MRRCLVLAAAGAIACGGQAAPPPPVSAPVAPPAAVSAPPPADCGAASAASPAWSGPPSTLPEPPPLPAIPLRADGGYTAWGAAHQLHSLLHHDEMAGAPVSIVGWIVDVNAPRAPACALHPAAKPDPPGCVAEVPSFWIADERAPAADAPRVRVVGWARNFAVVHDAAAAYRRLPRGARPKTPVHDDLLNVDVPFPLPAPGAKVRVTGGYGLSAAVGSDLVNEPVGGVLSMRSMDVLEPGPAP